MKTLRIFIADDHDVVRFGLKALIESRPGWEVCGEAHNGLEAVAEVKRLAPDIAILDISMPELNGLEAARKIRKACPHTEVLILTVHRSDELLREILDAGAKGYIVKSDSGRYLLIALEALANHKPFFTPTATEMLLSSFQKDAAGSSSPAPIGRRLTPREREIVQLLAEGKSSKEVATTLTISVRTAETHRANIMRKLDVHSVSELVRYAMRNRIIEP
jgi:DNA-binding NarL/FixJ family response regulator